MHKIFFILLFFYISNLQADIGSNSGYNIPRYISLKFNEVNLRVGPGKFYPILIKYHHKNFPIEVIEEYKFWRKIIDIEGNSGWIHKNQLKGERFALVKNQYNISSSVYSKPNGVLIGKIGHSNIVRIQTCLENWCLIKLNNNKGWINKKNLYGVYKKENINIPFYQPLLNQMWKINFKFLNNIK